MGKLSKNKSLKGYWMRHPFSEVKHNYIRMRHIILAVAVALCTALSTEAQNSTQSDYGTARKAPTLVIGIVIDQLRSDCLQALQPLFCQGGFNRLMRDGTFIQNVDFSNPPSDSPLPATSVIFTGAYPCVSAISASKCFNTQTRSLQQIFWDNDFIGNFTKETYSPKALQVSTISDEVRLASEGSGQVCSVAADAQLAILMAGHAANSATWINPSDGNWASTTYYRDFPSVVQMRNRNKGLLARLDTLSWQPLLEFARYRPYISSKRTTPFRYTFARNDAQRIAHFQSSPMCAEEITDIALLHLTSLNLGTRSQIDMLNVAYSAGAYESRSNSDYSLELVDTYVRLDRQIARLLDYAERSVGLANTMVIVIGTGYFSDNRADDKRFNIPTGEFRNSHAKSLLNMYLIAVYGNGDWVLGVANSQVYLNRKLIKERKVDIKQMRQQCADFLIQMSGVRTAYTQEDVFSAHGLSQALRFSRYNNIHTSGDVFLDILPGWTVLEDDNTPGKSRMVRACPVQSPLLIHCAGLKTQHLNESVEATSIAPTIATLLGIRCPNAASMGIIPLLKK